MTEENGKWVMHGVSADDSNCLHTVQETIEFINKVGFLPLFRNRVSGFSLEERTVANNWWGSDPLIDPWEWRGIIARSGDIAYGKFFDGKAGFISREWLPYFINYRRDGYDFDALWDDGKAGARQKKIMDCFDEDVEIMSPELKEKAGFGKGHEKGFDSVITNLQMQGYLCVKDFCQKKNKKGQPYGWAVAVYCMPEHIFGYDYVTSAYRESSAVSRNKIYEKISENFTTEVDKKFKF